MTPHTAQPKGSKGFTLIELLIVMGIIAVLASMLLPAMFAVSREGKVTEAKSLLARIGVALDTYARLYTYYPPDYIPQSSGTAPNIQPLIYNFQGSKSGTPPCLTKVPLPTPAYSPEALYYFLCHRFLSDEHPMLTLSGAREMTDTNNNGLPEVVDPWDRPFLYNRAQFPACTATYYNYSGLYTFTRPAPTPPVTVTVADNPLHNVNSYDLYSVGPDGQTGDQELLPLSAKTFVEFCTLGVNDFNDGNKDDDIRNWSN